MPIPTVAYLDIYTGDADQHACDEQAYVRTQTILSKNAMIYGLPSNPEDLSKEQQQILRELDVHMSSSSALLSTVPAFDHMAFPL